MILDFKPLKRLFIVTKLTIYENNYHSYYLLKIDKTHYKQIIMK